MAETVPVRLRRLVELGFLLRVLAADAVEWLARRRGTRCLFPDTGIYWDLGEALRRGEPFQVWRWGVPYQALRTPGYPLFLALCQAVFGDWTLPARLVQAALGALCVWLTYRLVKQVGPTTAECPSSASGWPPALIAAAIAAVDPWTIGMSALLLSEAVFVPLMLLGLWGMAALWSGLKARRVAPVALGTGAAFGAAVLVKPSFALFAPGAALAWIVTTRRREALVGSLLIGLGLAAVMAPWWVRNYRLYGRFVPTALWMGASLYDGLNPSATGRSDMRFLDAPELQALDEETLDRLLTRRAIAFAREHPGRVLALAASKAARFWSPWPNAEGYRSPLAMAAGILITTPVYLLILAGLWPRRRDARAWVLLAGPLLYFAAIHMVFASSVRYRAPGMVPAFGLAGWGAARWLRSKPGGAAGL
jgi:4-amino-4-deoxy-L-arabinose transferase-like glycosyltransferase